MLNILLLNQHSWRDIIQVGKKCRPQHVEKNTKIVNYVSTFRQRGRMGRFELSKYGRSAKPFDSLPGNFSYTYNVWDLTHANFSLGLRESDDNLIDESCTPWSFSWNSPRNPFGYIVLGAEAIFFPRHYLLRPGVPLFPKDSTVSVSTSLLFVLFSLWVVQEGTVSLFFTRRSCCWFSFG